MLETVMLRQIARFRAEAAQLAHSLEVFKKEHAEQLSHVDSMLVTIARQTVDGAESALIGLAWGIEDRGRE